MTQGAGSRQRSFYNWYWWNGGTQFDAAAAGLQMSSSRCRAQPCLLVGVTNFMRHMDIT